MAKIKRKQQEGFSAVFGDIEISHLEGTILASFFPEAEEMTIKEIQERTGYSYERVNSGLKSLTKKGIVSEKQKGKTLLYSLDTKSIYSYSLGFNRYMLQREVDFIKKNNKVYRGIKEIIEKPFIWMLILFGSYSKGSETSQSDVDLICISDNPEEARQFIASLKHTYYNIRFTPVIMPLHEFPNIKKENPELWNDLKLYGIIFKGDDYFYSWMYKNESN